MASQVGFCSRSQVIMADICKTCSTALYNLAKKIYEIAMSAMRYLKTIFCYPKTSESDFTYIRAEALENLRNMKAVARQIETRRARSQGLPLESRERELRECDELSREVERNCSRCSDRLSRAVAKLVTIATCRGGRVVMDPGKPYSPEVLEQMQRLAVPEMPNDIQELFTAHCEGVARLNQEEPLPELSPVLLAYLRGRVNAMEKEVGVQ